MKNATSDNSISAEIIAAHMHHSRQIRSMEIHQMFQQIHTSILRNINRLAKIFTGESKRLDHGV